MPGARRDLQTTPGVPDPLLQETQPHVSLAPVSLESGEVESAAVVGDAEGYPIGVTLDGERYPASPGVLGGIAHQFLSHPVDEAARTGVAVEFAHRDLHVHAAIGERGEQLAEGAGKAIALDLTAGNLGQHLTVLEKAGLVDIEKGYEGKRARTWVSLSAAGEKALRDEITQLKRLIHDVERATPKKSARQSATP